jgi:hypothetical protein
MMAFYVIPVIRRAIDYPNLGPTGNPSEEWRKLWIAERIKALAVLACFPQPAWIFGFFVAAAGAIAQDFVAGACQTACSGDLPSCGGFRRAAILPACF